jgi:hypothetical protein
LGFTGTGRLPVSSKDNAMALMFMAACWSRSALCHRRRHVRAASAIHCHNFATEIATALHVDASQRAAPAAVASQRLRFLHIFQACGEWLTARASVVGRVGCTVAGAGVCPHSRGRKRQLSRGLRRRRRVRMY